MASLISARLYNDDGTPKTGASPKLSAIRQSDKVEVLNSVDMVEAGAGFYEYEFVNYDKGQLYYYYIDGEVYDGVNQLDSYGNKPDRGKRPELIIDPYAISEAVWDTNTKDHTKEGTFGAIVQKPISYAEIIVSIDSIKNKIEETIKSIKLPKQINPNEIIDEISDKMDEKLANMASVLTENLKEEDEEDEVDETLEEVKNIANLLSIFGQNIDVLYNKLEEISKQDLIERLKEMDIDKVVEKIDTATSKRDEINTKHDQEGYELNKFNDNLMELKFTIKNLFTRLSMK